jgi:hypothetical protein
MRSLAFLALVSAGSLFLFTENASAGRFFGGRCGGCGGCGNSCCYGGGGWGGYGYGGCGGCGSSCCSSCCNTGCGSDCCNGGGYGGRRLFGRRGGWGGYNSCCNTCGYGGCGYGCGGDCCGVYSAGYSAPYYDGSAPRMYDSRPMPRTHGNGTKDKSRSSNETPSDERSGDSQD